MFNILQLSSRDNLPPTPTPGWRGCFPLPSEGGSRAIPPGGCIPVSRAISPGGCIPLSRGITPRSSSKPTWGSISRGGVPGCCISASSTWTPTPAGWCCIPCWGITRCITHNHCQRNSKLQHAPRHIHNVETNLHGPQAFLMHFQGSMMFSREKYRRFRAAMSYAASNADSVLVKQRQQHKQAQPARLSGMHPEEGASLRTPSRSSGCLCILC